MYRADESWVVSASDLVNYLECGRLMQLSAHTALHPGSPTEVSASDGHLAVLRRRGLEHERAYLEALRSGGRDICEVAEGAIETRVADTIRAIQSGVSVVYQATFLDGGDVGLRWRGHADFLELVDLDETASYEPVDTKLARHVKPGAILQLCQYATQLGLVQGSAPKQVHVQLGDGRRESVRLASVLAYFRLARRRFENAIDSFDGVSLDPDPVSHCGVCARSSECTDVRRAADHLTFVAGLGREHARKLQTVGVHTLAELAHLLPNIRVLKIGDQVVAKLRRQAALQLRARSTPDAEPPYEILEPSGVGRGLEGLPRPSSGDLYLDLEGDPYVARDGLEYLFGIGWHDGEFQFKAFWGHDEDGERRAFEAVIDLIAERRRADPQLHVYHYAGYERTAFGRLMGKYATRQDEVDDLFRGNVLVDLYRVVQQGVRVGVESYSIKKLEPLYMAARSATIVDAASSIVEYERWLETLDPQILDDIETYNRDDCESTWRLHRWLEERRTEGESLHGRAFARPTPDDSMIVLDSPIADASDLFKRLAGDLAVPPDRSAAPDDHARWVLAHLLEWHRREDKPVWWRYFDIVKDYAPGDLVDDGGCLDLLEYVGVDGKIKNSLLHRYRFDPEQEHKIKVGDSPPDPAVERDVLLHGADRVAPGEVVEIDPVAGELVLKRAANSAAVHPVGLMDHKVIGTEVIRDAIERVAEWSAANGIDAAGPYRALRDLLMGLPPRLREIRAGEPLQRKEEEALDAAIRLARRLDHGCLPIQGPPGAGKTYTSAHVIVDLVKAGKRVGVTANSHSVVSNLLDAVMKVAAKKGIVVTALQKDDGAGCTHPNVTHATKPQVVEDALAAGEVKLVAGTAWLFARSGMEEQLDYLFVDEAGQMSLANVVAIGTATRNIVLIGDPQQLPQPTKGTHPAGAGVAALEHLLNGTATLPAERGLFLAKSYRMHPEISRFISELSYDDRLSSVDECARQRVLGAGTFSGSGLRWVPVEHIDNKLSSDEEAAAVARIHASLIGRGWTDADGNGHTIGLDDVLVVAPYNAQVHAIGRILPAGAKVGTVDKFQGQQGVVVIVSMATSSADEAPRGMEFLLSANRLNVAVSRAKAMAIVVASPTLLTSKCRSLRQMQLVNGLCRFVEIAEQVSCG